MNHPADKRLRLADFMNAVIILLLLIGHGTYYDTQYWAKLFADKPLLRFVTYVDDELGAEIDELSYYQSETETTLHVWSRSNNLHGNARGGVVWGSIGVHQFSSDTKDERYNHMVKVYGGSENVLCKGELLIPVTAGEGRSTEVLYAFDEQRGAISSSVVLKALGSSYRAEIRRVIWYMEHHGFLLGLPQLIYSCVRLCFYRPFVALSYYFPLSMHRVASLIAYLPGLALFLVTRYSRVKSDTKWGNT